MKKLLTTAILIMASFFVTCVYADPQGGKDDNDDDVANYQKCVKTGMTKDCLRCHTVPSFKLKEADLDEGYEDMPPDLELVIKDKKIDHIYYDCQLISPNDFKNIFDYLDRHPELPRKIIVGVHNPGGSAFDGWRAVNLIISRWPDFDITTRLHGMAFSAGFMIFNAGEKRECSPHSELMWHEAAAWEMFSRNTSQTLRDKQEVYGHIQNNANTWLASRSKVSAEEINDRITQNRQGWWMNGQEAFDNGFCDKLIGVK